MSGRGHIDMTKDELIQFLKDNLKLKIHDEGSEGGCVRFSIELLVDDESICSKYYSAYVLDSY